VQFIIVKQNLQVTRKNHLYVPNKLYELSEQTYIYVSNKLNKLQEQNISTNRTNYMNCPNKYVYVETNYMNPPKCISANTRRWAHKNGAVWKMQAYLEVPMELSFCFKSSNFVVEAYLEASSGVALIM
jgi:hypothetical protein